MSERRCASWGRYPPSRPHRVTTLHWAQDALPADDLPLLAHGCGRSYGDSCLNNRGTLLVTTQLNRFLAFDREAGLLRCEAGVTLDEMLRLIVPQGWFLPVTPGTRFVTLGGAIANDVHGKNHHRVGSFGRFVRRLELRRSDGRRILCAPQENADWFRATVGGLGLTGVILWAEIALKPIMTPFMRVETRKFQHLDAFFELAAASERDYEYTVAWVDCLARGRRLGRGVFARANHAPAQDARPRLPRAGHVRLPFDLPTGALNGATVRLFNAAYFARARTGRRLQHYDAFFYPLDGVREWNRLYGRRGFVQYQCVVPDHDQGRAIRALLDRIAASGQASFLSVLKTFGNLPSPGLLSFPRPGVTLALDFPFRGEATLALLERLDAITREAGGAVYPAKDARMSAASFQAFFPEWRRFLRYVDPRFSSDLWHRVTQPLGDQYEKNPHRGGDLRDRTGDRQAVCR